VISRMMMRVTARKMLAKTNQPARVLGTVIGTLCELFVSINMSDTDLSNRGEQ
jgi:hypothetical protein